MRSLSVYVTVLCLVHCISGTYGACDTPFTFTRTPTSLVNSSTVLTGQRRGFTGQWPAAMSLFVGILTSSQGAVRREAIRGTWLSQMQVAFPHSTHRFVLTREEALSLSERELALHDTLVIDAPTGYHQITHKTFAVIQHAAAKQADFLLKIDDDAYVHVPAFAAHLRCTATQHAGHHLFIGAVWKESKVFTEPGHIFRNEEYLSHTSLTHYPRYMSGAGYVMSGSVAKVLAYMQEQVGLLWTRLEDVTIGFILSTLNVTWVEWNSVIITEAKFEKVAIDRSLCQRLTQLAIVHKLTPAELYTLHALATHACHQRQQGPEVAPSVRTG